MHSQRLSTPRPICNHKDQGCCYFKSRGIGTTLVLVVDQLVVTIQVTSDQEHLMQIYLDSFGAYLKVRDGMLTVQTRSGSVRQFAVREIESILITKGTALSTDAMLLAIEHQITLMLIDANTHRPLGVVWSAQPSGIAELKRQQLQFTQTWQAVAQAKDWVFEKTKRRLLLAQVWQEKWPNHLDWAAEQQKMEQLAARIYGWSSPEEAYTSDKAQLVFATLRGQEGTASRIWFGVLQKLVPPALGFVGRRRRPAFDLFNVLLNYLYGMLYTQCHLALLKCGLDVQFGIMHADQYAKPTLVYDFIEPYRVWAEEVAVQLAINGLLITDWFDEDDQSPEILWLNRQGKETVITQMLEFLHTSSLYGKQQVKRLYQIDMDARAFTSVIQKTRHGV
jgi:CRISP-associated protein Cas1